MGLRKDFLVHKRKTVESFRFVKADVSNIMINIENIKTMLSALESKTSMLDNNISDLKSALGKYSFDIESISKSAMQTSNSMNNFNKKIKKIASKNQTISKRVTGNSKSIKKLLPRSKRQLADTRKLNSALKQFQAEIGKLKNIFDRKLRIAKRSNLELEAKIKSQKKRIFQLNRKIENKKVIRKVAKKTIRRITPKKTVTKTITPRKVVTKTITPTKKTITEVKK